jgi:uncharacterized repeat protein (TIGR01451 family)
MSVNVLPSIAGTVFQDMSLSGAPTAADPRLAGVTVNLWLDGGDGKFEGKSAGSDDTLVGTATTDANGNYSFANLSPGTYFVQQTPVPGLAFAGGQGVLTVTIASSDEGGQAGTVIDSFNATPQMVSDSLFGGRTVSSAAGMNVPIVGGTGVASTLAVPGVLGGYRTLFVQRTSLGGAISMDADANAPGALEFDSNAASNGIYWVAWDGNGSQILNPTGLGQVDLTSQGTDTGLTLTLGADHDSGYVLLKVYSDAADWSQASVAIPNTTDGSLGQSVFVPWTSFSAGGGAGAAFTKVGAVQMEIDGVSAIDGQVGAISTAGPKIFTENFANDAEADLAVVKTASPNPVVAGQQLSYTLAATNNGPSPATGVTITDPLPASLTFVSATSSQGTVSCDSSGTLTASLGSLANGASATVNVVTTVAASATGTVTNTATISGDQTDPNPANNTSTVTTTINQPVKPQDYPDLAIVKTATPSPVAVGANLTYTLAVSNESLTADTGVTVSDPLPAGVTFVSATASQGTASINGNTVQASLGSMAANGTATVTIVVNVTSSAGSTIINTATVAGDLTEATLANNTSTVVTPVTRGPFGKWMFVHD